MKELVSSDRIESVILEFRGVKVMLDQDLAELYEVETKYLKRQVKLFSSILRHDDDDCFYLITPVEKVRIVVDDAPFIAVLVVKIIEDDVEYLRFTTLTEDVIILDAEHPLWVNERADGEPRPYIHVRDRLDALIHRNVFYQLVEWATRQEIDGQWCYAVQSAGQWFAIAAGD